MQASSGISHDSIIALATPYGLGAIAVIRLSGQGVIDLADAYFKAKGKGKTLNSVASHTVHLGYIMDEKRIIDEVLVTVFRTKSSPLSPFQLKVSGNEPSWIFDFD